MTQSYHPPHHSPASPHPEVISTEAKRSGETPDFLPLLRFRPARTQPTHEVISTEAKWRDPRISHLLLLSLSLRAPTPTHEVISTEAKRSGETPEFRLCLAFARTSPESRIATFHPPPPNSLMAQGAFIYILASTYKHLYIGVTTDLTHRIHQHKTGAFPGSFTHTYRIDQLVYVERFLTINEAIPREKQLKRWSRLKKLNLIVQQNPDWQDLSLVSKPKP